MLQEFVQTIPANTQEKQDTHGKQRVSDCCENQTRIDASVLVWRILSGLFKVACMLLELFQTTSVNTEEQQNTHGIRLADDCCDNQTRTDASVLVWRMLFQSLTDACML
jgi:hypothetical protein